MRGIHRLLAAALALLLPAAALTTAVQLENHDGFCAACHTRPETAYVARSQAGAVDLASAHTPEGVRCVDCHSGEGLAGRTVSLRQGATDLLAYLSGSFTRPAVTQHPVGDRGCLKCHISPGGLPVPAPDRDTLSNSHYHRAAYLAGWQAQAAGPRGTCAQCHPAHTPGSGAGQLFVIQGVAARACEGCHRALSGWLPPGPG